MKKFIEILLVVIVIFFGSTSSLAIETTYTVKSGDSLWKIATHNGMTVKQLMELNDIQSDKLSIGDKLILHADMGQTQNIPTVTPTNSIYIVQAGDCLSLIADRFGMSVQTLKQINQLSSDFLNIGQKIQVKANTGGENAIKVSAAAVTEPSAVAVVPSPQPTAESFYIVQAGDCIGRIAEKYSMSSNQLMSLNGLGNDRIYPGQKLVLTASTTAEVSRSGSTVDGQRIIDMARQYLGVPYVYGGTTPAGFDCSGYVQYVFKQCGYQLNRTAAAQYQQGTAVSKSDLVTGDIVFFACNGSGIDHSGIYAGDNRFIHSSSPRSGGVIITSLAESYYARSYVGARRVIR